MIQDLIEMTPQEARELIARYPHLPPHERLKLRRQYQAPTEDGRTIYSRLTRDTAPNFVIQSETLFFNDLRKIANA